MIITGVEGQSVTIVARALETDKLFFGREAYYLGLRVMIPERDDDDRSVIMDEVDVDDEYGQTGPHSAKKHTDDVHEESLSVGRQRQWLPNP